MNYYATNLIEMIPNFCQTPRSMYPSIFNSFPVIRTASAKIDVFTYRSPHFCFPWRRPSDYHAICCMDGKTILVKPLAACTHLSSTVSQLFEPQVENSPFSVHVPHPTTSIWHVTSFVNRDNFMVLICAIRFYLNDN